jgi:hypothetical protein
MTATTPSTALTTTQPAFTDTERLALAGFLAGYRGLTREACTLDLRQFTGWCQARSLPLFAVRRADIETFARELEARGRARATVTRRLERTFVPRACAIRAPPKLAIPRYQRDRARPGPCGCGALRLAPCAMLMEMITITMFIYHSAPLPALPQNRE